MPSLVPFRSVRGLCNARPKLLFHALQKKKQKLLYLDLAVSNATVRFKGGSSEGEESVGISRVVCLVLMRRYIGCAVFGAHTLSSFTTSSMGRHGYLLAPLRELASRKSRVKPFAALFGVMKSRGATVSERLLIRGSGGVGRSCRVLSIGRNLHPIS